MKWYRMTQAGLALLAAVVLLAGCSRSGNANGHSRVIVPKAVDDSVNSPSQTAAAGTLTVAAMPQPRITIDPRDTVLQVINASLKKGPEEEQVIAVKRVADMDSHVRLIVVDVDPERGTYYFQSWESPTNATDNRIFTLAVKDLLGDHDVELVASGMNKEGRLTLDVFRRTKDPYGSSLVYAPICQIVADDIHILESDRPDSYTSDQKSGDSFPIDTFVRDPDSQNLMDLLKISYQWSPRDGRYVPGPPDKVPGEKVAQAQLSKLFSSLSPDSFEDFLAGSWVETDTDSTPRVGAATSPTELSFDPRSRKIVVSTGDTEEVFSWRLTARTIYNSARLVADNETVSQISRTFEITALSTVSLSVAFVGDDSPDRPQVSTYSRISDQLQANLLRHAAAPTPQPLPHLNGQYFGSSRIVVSFTGSQLRWKESGKERTAEYVLFPLMGKIILSARFFGSNQSDEDKSWVADFRESKNPARTRRTLVLSPVQLTVSGYEDAVGDTISLEQEIDFKAR